ncbi:MAG: AIPR family protein [Deltaproteobacteria bacterium]|jgi:hypothetical protein
MSIFKFIRESVSKVASQKGIGENKAFAYWFLEQIEELSEEDAELTVLDGPWDAPRDTVYYDDEEATLKIYQFRYGQDLNHIIPPLRQLQKAAKIEVAKLPECLELKFIIVTMTWATDVIYKEAKKSRKKLTTWLARNDYMLNADIEVFDLKKFAQIFDKIYGIDVVLKYKMKPMIIDDSILGLINARVFLEHMENDQLLALKIRRFLGFRKGSVNWQIRQTLEDGSYRNRFWILNNGIVCLCTDFKEMTNESLFFNNLTIVNGVQTISTITKFLENNTAFREPIWVFAKVIKIKENDVRCAIEVVKASNTQTPINNKDLRTVETSHIKLKKWFNDYFNVTYIYKRNDFASNERPVVSMKELAQAYLAYWYEEPHISFGRPGTIFVKSSYYDRIFPGSDIDRYQRNRDKEGIITFLNERLLPLRILSKIKEEMEDLVTKEYDQKWKALAYHILWIYGVLCRYEKINDNSLLLGRCDLVVQETIKSIYDALVYFCKFERLEIPNDLKTPRFAKKINDRNLFENSRNFLKARAELRAILRVRD